MNIVWDILLWVLVALAGLTVLGWINTIVTAIERWGVGQFIGARAYAKQVDIGEWYAREAELTGADDE